MNERVNEKKKEERNRNRKRNGDDEMAERGKGVSGRAFTTQLLLLIVKCPAPKLEYDMDTKQILYIYTHSDP